MEGNGQEFPLDLSSFDMSNFPGNPDVGTMFNAGNGLGSGMHREQPQANQQQRQSQQPMQIVSGNQPQDPRNSQFFGQFTVGGDNGIAVDDFQQLLMNMGPSAQNTQASLTVTAEHLKEQLAQQLKLQQLQQLQNRILQEQIQLLAGNRLGSKPDLQQLLTPANTDIRSASQSTQVSPAMLPPNAFMQSHHVMNSMGNATNTSHFHPGMGAMSAPASIAFNQHQVESPAFLTPLTSPVFPPVSNHNGHSQQALLSNKRSADALQDGEMTGPTRKRVSTNFPPNTISPAVLGRTKHVNSLDTPSPVDLSMPPPAAPLPSAPSRQSLPSPPLRTPAHSTNVSPDIIPATPAILMDMGPNFSLPPGLLPPGAANHSDRRSEDNNATGKKKTGKAATSRPRAASTTTVATGRARRTTAGRGAAGASASSYSSATGASTAAAASLPPRKNTHKDAEQRRRDSLKQSFDELRTLLPPIPLSAGSDPDDPPLPGAMPPRGPPKGDGDGPNRGVSKLALLRCGNEFIMDLRGRVERRDDEIAKLRNEISRLRLMIGEMSLETPNGDIVDIEKDMVAEDEHYREERRKIRRVQRIIEEDGEGD